MIIGVPREIKVNENRVGCVPQAVATFVKRGHKMLVEKNAGLESGFPDDMYRNAGAEIVNSPADVYGKADMIIKVKEPIEPEYSLIRKGQIVFTYFHFAASRQLTDAMLKSGCIAIAYETVQPPTGLCRSSFR